MSRLVKDSGGVGPRIYKFEAKKDNKNISCLCPINVIRVKSLVARDF